MCVDPITGAAIASAVVSVAGTAMEASAQQKQSAAIGAQNQTLANAQNQAFEQRVQAGFQQTAAQQAAQQQTLSDRATASAQTGTQQMAALKNYSDTLNAENTQATNLRSTGDAAAQALLAQTSAANLAGAQTQQQQQAAALIAGQPQGGQTGPQVSDPNGPNAVSNDPTQQAAAARGAAEAATNIRNYGAKVAAVNSYDAPVQNVGLAIAGNQAGIMPAQMADQLLRSGSNTLLLPTQTAYAGATAQGQTLDTLLQSQGQSALDAAGLSYGNATDIANLTQGDADTIAKNKLAQQTADIGGQAAIGAGISSLGNLGLRAYGQFGGADLNSKISSLFGTNNTNASTS